jgi:hypothetical protein
MTPADIQDTRDVDELGPRAFLGLVAENQQRSLYLRLATLRTRCTMAGQ